MAHTGHRGTVAAALACALLGAVLAGCGSGDEQHGADKAAGAFLDAWSDGDHAKAASFTDAPRAARTELARLREELRIRRAEFDPGARRQGGGKDDTAATVPFDAALTLTRGGTWRYGSAAEVRKTADGWKVHFTPSVLHPKLRERTHLVLRRELPERAGILAADGSDLAPLSTVWAVSIWPAELSDPARAYRALADPRLGADIDIGALKARVRRAAPDQSVPVVTLRDAVYRKVRERLVTVPGLQFRDFERALPARSAPLVGSVQPATSETLQHAGPAAAPSDEVGATGLQYRYQRRLAGTPGVRVLVVDKATKQALREVYRTRPERGTPVRTTLEPKVQRAAENALESVPSKKKAALVALRPSTGEVLAVADTPADGRERALTGRYAPGSTFKVVTSAALLGEGVEPGTPAPCPRTVTVNGQRFENQAEFSLPRGTTFRQDFAQSCNTGFIRLRDRLDDRALSEAAAWFGMGGTWRIGAASFDGRVPVTRTENAKAASMIGQGGVEASPLVMASVAATVKQGAFRQPVLVPAAAGRRHRASGELPAGAAERLRTMMRAVVTEGSGKALRGIPGGPAAKTGTAEYGEETPPRTHAWIIGYRGDLAFAVLVEDGGSGGRDAGPVAAEFLTGLGKRP